MKKKEIYALRLSLQIDGAIENDAERHRCCRCGDDAHRCRIVAGIQTNSRMRVDDDAETISDCEMPLVCMPSGACRVASRNAACKLAVCKRRARKRASQNLRLPTAAATASGGCARLCDGCGGCCRGAAAILHRCELLLVRQLLKVAGRLISSPSPIGTPLWQ